MAMQVAMIAVGAGAAGMAFAAEAEAGGAAAAGAGAEIAGDTSGADAADPTERMRVNGWSCWGKPVSRGPLAPPPETADFDALLAEVPA